MKQYPALKSKAGIKEMLLALFLGGFLFFIIPTPAKANSTAVNPVVNKATSTQIAYYRHYWRPHWRPGRPYWRHHYWRPYRYHW